MSTVLSSIAPVSQKSSNFFNKEKRRFQTYSLTCRSDVKKPTMRFERPKSIRIMSYITTDQPDSSQIPMLKLASDSQIDTTTDRKLNSIERATINSTMLSPEEPNAYSYSMLNSKRLISSSIEHQSSLQNNKYHNSIATIINRCTKLNRDVGKFEKKLTRTESRLFDRMTTILKKSNAPQKFKFWEEDKNFLSKKKQLYEGTQREREETKTNMYRNDVMYTAPDVAERITKNQFQSPILVLDKERSIEADKRYEKIIINSPRILNLRPRKDNSSPTKQAQSPEGFTSDGNYERGQLLKTQSKIRLSKKKNAIKEEYFINELENRAILRREQSQDRDRINKKSLMVQTYAVQRDDFLVNPFASSPTKTRESVSSKSKRNKSAKTKQRMLQDVIQRINASVAGESTDRAILISNFAETRKSNSASRGVKSETIKKPQVVVEFQGQTRNLTARAKNSSPESKLLFKNSESLLDLYNVVNSANNRLASSPLRMRKVGYTSLRERIDTFRAGRPTSSIPLGEKSALSTSSQFYSKIV